MHMEQHSMTVFSGRKSISANLGACNIYNTHSAVDQTMECHYRNTAESFYVGVCVPLIFSIQSIHTCSIRWYMKCLHCAHSLIYHFVRSCSAFCYPLLFPRSLAYVVWALEASKENLRMVKCFLFVHSVSSIALNIFLSIFSHCWNREHYCDIWGLRRFCLVFMRKWTFLMKICLLHICASARPNFQMFETIE